MTMTFPLNPDYPSRMARVCYRVAETPPATFREVVQWIAIFNMASRTYNRDGAGGQLDELLRPYWERDKAAGILTDEDAEFYVFCLLLNDPHYYQIGGPDAEGRDQTSRMSYIILEAAAKLKSSCNLTIRVWDGMDRGLFRRGVEILLANRLGYPRFSGDKAPILDNLRRLDDVGVPFWIRCPLVPGLNDTDDDLAALRDFIATLRHAEKVEICPYHPLGLEK